MGQLDGDTEKLCAKELYMNNFLKIENRKLQPQYLMSILINDYN